MSRQKQEKANQSRRRGVLLTSVGETKLNTAKRDLEFSQYSGNHLTLETLSEITGLSVDTVNKVFRGETRVDKHTLKQCFQSLGLGLEPEDYYVPNFSPWGNSSSGKGSEAKQNSDDWANVDRANFYGRQAELNQLVAWMVDDATKLVMVHGMGGIGKTSLAVKAVQQVQASFDIVIGRSLQNSPLLSDLLTHISQQFSFNGTKAQPQTHDLTLDFLTYCQQHRCLLILDNVESILEPGAGGTADPSGCFRAEYRDYETLIRRWGNMPYQSCILMTSREQLTLFAELEERNGSVQSMPLGGLADSDAIALIQRKSNLQGDDADWKSLLLRYGNNPLALKMTATAIEDLFQGQISQFLSQGSPSFGSVRRLLDEHFHRLSTLEVEILYWLGLSRQALSMTEISAYLHVGARPRRILECLRSLTRRSLVEQHQSSFTLQPVILEYITENLIEEICEEVLKAHPWRLKSHALLHVYQPDFIRQSQLNLMIRPILQSLQADLRGSAQLQQHLHHLLQTHQQETPDEASYLAGNLINFLLEQGGYLRNSDFSSLTIWQANFEDQNLSGCNFADANLQDCRFSKVMGGIYSIAFSPTEPLIATCGDDGNIRLWQPFLGQQLASWPLGDFWIFAIAFSPDGRSLVSGSNEFKLRLWDVKSGNCFMILSGHQNLIFSVDYSPDGRYIASASTDQTVRLWCAKTGECLKVFSLSSAMIAVRFSVEGKFLAGGGHDQRITLWDLETHQCHLELMGHQAAVFSIAFSDDQQKIATSSHDNTVKIWDWQGHCLFTLQHQAQVCGVAFSPDSQWLISGSLDHSLRIWDVGTGECLRHLKSDGLCSWSLSLVPQRWGAAQFGNDHLLVTSAGPDALIQLWDLQTGQCRQRIQGNVAGLLSMAIDPTGSFLVSGSEDKRLFLWDLVTQNILQIFEGHQNWVWRLAFSPDGSMLASASQDRTVRVWSVDTAQCLHQWEAHEAGATGISFSPDGKQLASSGLDGTVKLWNLETGLCQQSFIGHTNWVWQVCFSPDGTLVASASEDHCIRLWTAEGELIQMFEGHGSGVNSIAFSPNGQQLASGCNDGTIKIWDIQFKECLRTIMGHQQAIWSLCFECDGQHLISGSHDQTLCRWQLSTGDCLQTYAGHTKAVYGAILSPHQTRLSQTRLYSCSKDETIRIWNRATGECEGVLKVPKLYEGMNITHVTGLTEAQHLNLQRLGAIATKP